MRPYRRGEEGNEALFAKLSVFTFCQIFDPIQTEGGRGGEGEEGNGIAFTDFTLTLIFKAFNRATSPQRKLKENCRKNDVSHGITFFCVLSLLFQARSLMGLTPAEALIYTTISNLSSSPWMVLLSIARLPSALISLVPIHTPGSGCSNAG